MSAAQFEVPYPPSPKLLADRLAGPTSRYRRHAWFAMIALLAFFALFLAIPIWFGVRAWQLFAQAYVLEAGDRIIPIFAGSFALMLAAFMLKALFFIKRDEPGHHVEIHRADQPRLFAFIDRLADEVGAPRPHKVLLTTAVNAAVSYDLSLLNFFLPTRKNLVIGLGLVNVLNLSEFKAVLAHEFGHFAQRTMAVGRWVYVAQQIANALINRRDAFDKFLNSLSSADIRFAWAGWLLGTIVWSIRSLADSVFRVVAAAHFALSREMEYQADLVAVSLTGSDALIHALYRLPAADRAMDRVFAFASNQWRQQRFCEDIFAVQTHVLEVHNTLHGARHPLAPPTVPAERPQDHRVFDRDIVDPPRMWLEHPLNHEREINAKRDYVAAELDDRPAWIVFDDVQALRARVSRPPIDLKDASPLPTPEAIALLDAEYDLRCCDPRYRGLYLARDCTRSANEVDELIDPAMTGASAEYRALYPPSLAEWLDDARRLDRELNVLRAVREGRVTPDDGLIRYRGQVLKRGSLDDTIARATEELAEIERRLDEHNRRVRGFHQAVARSLGQGWDEYHLALIRLLHYAEHARAHFFDVRGMLAEEYHRAIATARVGERQLTRLVARANELHTVVAAVYTQSLVIDLPEPLLTRLDLSRWSEAFGEFKLGQATRDNIQNWLDVVDSWQVPVEIALNRLGAAVLEELLTVEEKLSAAHAGGAALAAAPSTPRMTTNYPRFPIGQERQFARKLDWWTRFRIGDGWVPGIVRLVVAATVFFGVYVVGDAVGRSPVIVFNGLDTMVAVEISGETHALAPLSTWETRIPQRRASVVARTRDGREIERFEAVLADIDSNAAYSVAGAAMLLGWESESVSASVMPLAVSNTQRWFAGNRSYVFHLPNSPRSPGQWRNSRELEVILPRSPYVLAHYDAGDQARAVAEQHARWDDLDSPGLVGWFRLLEPSVVEAVLQSRLQDAPDDVVLRRLEWDLASDRAAVCARHRKRAEERPEDLAWRYLSLRCAPPGPVRDRATEDAFAANPEHAWLALAVAEIAMRDQQWARAETLLDQARRRDGTVLDAICLNRIRLLRLAQGADASQGLDSADCPPLGGIIAQGGAMEQERLERRPSQALAIAMQRSRAAHDEILRLIAAAPDAWPIHVQTALAMEPLAGLTARTAPSAVGLALAHDVDPAPYMPVLRNSWGEQAASADALVMALRWHDAKSAETAMRGLPLELLGQAYVIGCTALGTQAPDLWRETATRLLFDTERPLLNRQGPQADE